MFTGRRSYITYTFFDEGLTSIIKLEKDYFFRGEVAAETTVDESRGKIRLKKKKKMFLQDFRFTI